MRSSRITWSREVGAADWIVHRIAGPTGTLGSIMPADFSAYVRIPHQGDAHATPAQGSLPAELAGVIVSIAGEFTRTPQHCWFGLWDGYGWLYASRGLPTDAGTLASLPAVSDAPRVHLPNRDFLLFTAPIRAATALIGYPTHQTPNLWWPDDRAWFVATDIDLKSTYIGGSRPLVERVLADPRCAATPASLADAIVE